MTTNYDLGTYAIYAGNTWVGDVSFNEATGRLYRTQPYGEEPVHGMFAIQAGLRDHGRYAVRTITAVSHHLTGGSFRTLTLANEAVGIHRCGTSD